MRASSPPRSRPWPTRPAGRPAPARRRCRCRCCSSATSPGTRRGPTSVPLLVDAPRLDHRRTAMRLWGRAGQPSDHRDFRLLPGHLQLGALPARSAAPSRVRRRSAAAARRPARRPPTTCAGRPGAERRRAGTARPPHRAGGRLGRPRAARRVAAASCTSSRPGPGTATGARSSGGCAPAAGAAAASPPCSPATPAPARPCPPRSSPASSASTSTRSNLATVVDKYVGETEKNLERIFAEAAGVNARAALRRGRRHLRQAQRGPRRPRPLRQHRERLPAAAHGDLRRPGDPRHQPARQHRRGVHPAARRDRRLPDAGRGAAAGHLATCLAPPVPRARRPRPGVLRPVLRAVRRQHPLRRHHRRLPRRRLADADRHDAADLGRPAGVPQARPAAAGTRVRPLPRVAASDRRVDAPASGLTSGWAVPASRSGPR